LPNSIEQPIPELPDLSLEDSDHIQKSVAEDTIDLDDPMQPRVEDEEDTLDHEDAENEGDGALAGQDTPHGRCLHLFHLRSKSLKKGLVLLGEMRRACTV
jgi:hypothetical protein